MEKHKKYKSKFKKVIHWPIDNKANSIVGQEIQQVNFTSIIPKDALLILPKNSGLAEYRSKLEELPNQKMVVRGEDVPFFVESLSKKGVKCFGVTGEDLFKEYKFKEPFGSVTKINTVPWVDEAALFGKPALCLLGPQGKSLNNLDTFGAKPIIAISSKYKSIANNYLGKLEQKGFSFEKIYLTGAIETAAKLGIVDLAIDIVSSGRSAKEAGLRVYDRIMESNIVIVGVRE